jgi:hypothetical protein
MSKLTLGRVLRMSRTPSHLAGLTSVVIMLAACDGGTSSPTSPTLTAATPPTTFTFTLSGAVSETTATGPTLIRGARVADVGSGRAAVTDASGLYSISGLSPASHAFSITRDGYVTETRTVTISGDAQLDVQLQRMEAYTLFGVAFEMTTAGRVPIEGVEIYCDSCGSPDGHTFVYTDADGFYSFAWARNGFHPLLIRKTGYNIFDSAATSRDSYGRITATVHGDTRFDVQLVKE